MEVGPVLPWVQEPKVPLTRPPVDSEADEGPEPTRPVFGPPRVRLALSGSGLRLYAQLGAVARLMELGFAPEETQGTSGGAIVAAAIASGMSPSEMRQTANKLVPAQILKPRWFPGATEGFLSNDPILDVLRKVLPSSFDECILPVHVVTSNWTRHSQAVVWTSGDLPLCVMASMALPVFDMVTIQGMLVDDAKSGLVYGFNAAQPMPSSPQGLARLIPGRSAGPGALAARPKHALSTSPELYQDGGVSGNFLVDYDGWKNKSNAPTIGLRVRGLNEPSLRAKPKTKLERAISTMADLVDAQDFERVSDSPDARVCFVETRYSGFDPTLGRDDIAHMMREGAASMERFLDLNSDLL